MGLEEHKGNLDRILSICRDPAVSLTVEKLETSLHCLAFFGIKTDASAGRLQLLSNKLSRLGEWSA